MAEKNREGRNYVKKIGKTVRETWKGRKKVVEKGRFWDKIVSELDHKSLNYQ